MIPDSPIQRERDQRIAELELRLRRASAVGVRAPIALAAILATGILFAMQRKELAYFFSPRQPISLGTEGEYRLDALRSNRYGQIHGIPTVRGAYAKEKGKTYVLVGIRDSSVIVRRPPLKGEEWMPGETPPQPNQSPFAVRGRLLSQEDASRYREAFEKLAGTGELSSSGPLWILLEGERPGSDVGTLLFGAALSLFFLLNVWLLWRALEHRFRPLRDA